MVRPLFLLKVHTCKSLAFNPQILKKNKINNRQHFYTKPHTDIQNPQTFLLQVSSTHILAEAFMAEQGDMKSAG